MPFDRNGVWTQPVKDDHEEFQRQIMSRRKEIAPTPDMIKAIAANLPTETSSNKAQPDVFNTIGKLKGAVDIVIPIYDGLHVLIPCIESIVKRTEWDYNLILVDDCSPDPEVKKYLKSLDDRYLDLNYQVVYNTKNRGFAPTVNRGVALGKNPYVCVLNSDTLVTEGWLVRQLMALEADERNVIVNPATNNTALVNVPMYNGASYLDMAHAVAVAGNTLTYNEIMPTGFCYTLRRSLWDEVGPFDEAYISYGEETDLWFKSIKQTDENGVVLHNRGVIADNAYVYHERGTSFSQLGDDEHIGLRRSGSARFNELHPDFMSWQQGFNPENAVDHLRSKLPKEAFKRVYRNNIAFVVKSAGPCGGMNFIADIVNRLIEEGYNAKVCVVPDAYDEENPPTLDVVGHLRTSPILFKTQDEFTSTFTQRVFTRGKVFAAVTELTPIVWDLHKIFKGIEGYNFVQSYDPELAELEGKSEYVDEFKESYRRLPNVCASLWIAELLTDTGDCAVEALVTPGVNTDLFHPRNRGNGDERFTVAVVMNDRYKAKGTEWALQFLKALDPPSQPDIRVLAIGPKSLPNQRGVTCLGIMSQAKMASLLGQEVDLLIEPSIVHSYGMPALEALASGCGVISRNNKGINEYEEVWDSRVHIIDDPEAAAQDVIAMSGAEKSIRTSEVIIPPSAHREYQVQDFIKKVFPTTRSKKARIEVVTPHLRKHGGPTTIVSTAKQLQALGHNVDMAMIYTDWNPEVLGMARGLQVKTSWEIVPDDVEIVIINSDNPFADKFFNNYPDKKFIMLKLSHNPRFLSIENNNLKLPWDHVVTSTEWLRQVCIKPLGGKWDHLPLDPNKVTTIGWYHYGHNVFNMPPTNRTYGNAKLGFSMGTLVHDHPLKGSSEAFGVIEALKKKYEANFQPVGFGELRTRFPNYMQYFRSASREDMAYAFKQLDVWYGASHSEGLGRMALEAMSAGVLVVTTDTGAEFLKHEENCLLYPVGDPQAGAELVVRAVEDEELFTKLIVNGHRTAAGAANPNTYRSNLEKVVQSVLSKGD